METGSSATMSLWLEQVGAGHHHALALAAGQLVGILLQHLFAAHADHVERVLDQRLPFFFAARQLEVLEHHVEDVLDPVEGVVDGVRILKDRLHLAPVVHELLFVHGADVDALVDDLPAGDLGEAQHQVGQRRLAAAAFAGDGGDRGWAIVDGQVEVLQGDRNVLGAKETAAVDLGCALDFEKCWAIVLVCPDSLDGAKLLAADPQVANNAAYGSWRQIL